MWTKGFDKGPCIQPSALCFVRLVEAMVSSSQHRHTCASRILQHAHCRITLGRSHRKATGVLSVNWQRLYSKCLELLYSFATQLVLTKLHIKSLQDSKSICCLKCETTDTRLYPPGFSRHVNVKFKFQNVHNAAFKLH